MRVLFRWKVIEYWCFLTGVLLIMSHGQNNMRKPLLMLVGLFAVGMLAAACGGGDPTPIPAASILTAQDIGDAVDRAIAGAAAEDTSPEEIQANDFLNRFRERYD